MNQIKIDYTSDKFNNVTVSDYIIELAGNDSRLHKEAVLSKALTAAKIGSAQGEAFFYNLYLACNPFITYGVKQVPKTEGLLNKPNPYPTFWQLAEDLRSRKLTGHAAKRAIEQVSELFDSNEWNLMCRPVLIKDLRCGVSEKTINKIVGKTEWKIPTFGCQLASSSDDNPKMVGLKRIEGKLDGVRVLAMVSGKSDNVVLCSRNGKEFHNFPQIKEAIIEIRSKLAASNLFGGKGIVFDGEIIGESFQALMKQAQRKSDVETSGMIYNIFDIIPLEDFSLRGFWNAQQSKRTEWLMSHKEIIESQSCLKITDGIMVDLDTAEGHDIMRRYANDAVNAGLEGIMIKSWDAPYECKRSSFWMKWKPVITVDLTIVKVEEGTGRNQGRLGNFICEGIDNGCNITVSVGSGFSDADRDGYWSARDELLGNVVEVMADAITQNQDGTYSLRFPRFVRFRGFEAGEKI